MVFGINSSRIVNRKEIVLGFTSHYFTPSYLQCSHYLSQPAILLHILTLQLCIQLFLMKFCTATTSTVMCPNLLSVSIIESDKIHCMLFAQLLCAKKL